MSNTKQNLIVVTGPTGSGKTKLAIELALHYGCEIISADSRQVYKELKIGSAAPDSNELSQVNHHFIASHTIEEDFNAGIFEHEASKLLETLFQKNNTQVICGGSGLYIKALLEGLDEFPEIDPEIRKKLNQTFEIEGIISLQAYLKEVDFEYYQAVDLNNHRRIIRALEVYETSGKAYSSFKKTSKAVNNYQTILIATDLPRAELYDKINERTLRMLDAGWIKECQDLLPFKNKNALKTLGYKEIFEYLEGKISHEECTKLIQQNTRRYAKMQMTFIRNQLQAQYFHPEKTKEILAFLKDKI